MNTGTKLRGVREESSIEHEIRDEKPPVISLYSETPAIVNALRDLVITD